MADPIDVTNGVATLAKGFAEAERKRFSSYFPKGMVEHDELRSIVHDDDVLALLLKLKGLERWKAEVQHLFRDIIFGEQEIRDGE
jgi:hypothetical protein